MMNKAKNNKDAARDAEQNPYKKYAALIEDCEFGSEKGAENLLAILKQRDELRSEVNRWQDDAMKLSHQVMEQTSKLQDAE